MHSSHNCDHTSVSYILWPIDALTIDHTSVSYILWPIDALTSVRGWAFPRQHFRRNLRHQVVPAPSVAPDFRTKARAEADRCALPPGPAALSWDVLRRP